MDTLTNGLLQLGPASPRALNGRNYSHVAAEATNGHAPHARHRDTEFLRRCAWEIGEKRPAESFCPSENHAGLALATPTQGFAYWRIRQDWVDHVAHQKGGAWHNCRLIVRLYDVSYIEFTGLNAHHIRDFTLPALCGQMLFPLRCPGTWQIAEVGFLLRNGEFIPAARSQTVSFSRDTASPRHEQTALLVSPNGRLEEIGNVWDQAKVLNDRRQARLRHPLRIASFAFISQALGHEGDLARFVAELAVGQSAAGHDVHVFVPASPTLTTRCQIAGVHYHPLEIPLDRSPLEQAESFRQAASERLCDLPPFDLLHMHEWMTGLTPRDSHLPTILSLGSLEATRRNGTPPDELSEVIAEAERDAAHAADCILTPPWLRDRAVAELQVAGDRVRAFPMEGRVPDEWEAPLDFGQVKKEIGIGPVDRMLLFVGPLEHAAGVDVLLEALPVLLHRAGNLRLVFAGGGHMHGALQHRAHQMGVAGVVRVLGHVESWQLTRLLRSAEALVLPSRFRVPFDDAVVDLARRAGRPVITTHGGPAHLVRHEENGIITYDNANSMVWAIDRILGDPAHAERMGRNGQRRESEAVIWSEVARHYLELCAAHFPELNQLRLD